MKSTTAFFHCGDYLRETLRDEIQEVQSVIAAVRWAYEFGYREDGTTYKHQAGYNRAFGREFRNRGWEPQPLLSRDPRLIGDFRKGLVFVEIQFGNSAALYRDYYKFQYGLANGLLSLAVLIVPADPGSFFPTRPKSVQNMADYSLAHTCFSVLPINVPTFLIGLLAEN
ncbi:MAG: hypothetical protein H5T64_06730 [Chloroflexi bacterium]|nr:hypothetical protein [Chloroflexota bacterium]